MNTEKKQHTKTNTGEAPIEQAPENMDFEEANKEQNSNTILPEKSTLLGSGSSAERAAEVQNIRETASGINRMHIDKPKYTCAQRRKYNKARKIAAGTWTEEKPSAHKRKPLLTEKEVGAAPGTTKRSRSDGSTPPAKNPAKRHRTEKDTVSFSEKLTSIRVAVILESYPDQVFAETDLMEFQNKLLDEMRPLPSGTGPQFRGCKVEGGAILLTCAEKHTQSWLQDCVAKMNLWKGEKLVMGLAKEILQTTKIITKLPPLFNNNKEEEVFKRLEMQNPMLSTSDWRILNTKMESSGKTIVVSVNKSGLSRLKESSMKLFLGFGQITLSVLEKTPRPKDVEDIAGKSST